jgi:hypothetical protein
MIVRLSSVERSTDETGKDVPQPGEQSDVVARAQIRVNVPPPVAKTFGTGPPTFIKASGRSPHASPPSSHAGVYPGELPPPGSARPVEISRPPRGLAGKIVDRLRATSPGDRLLAIAVVFVIVFLAIVVRMRSHP